MVSARISPKTTPHSNYARDEPGEVDRRQSLLRATHSHGLGNALSGARPAPETEHRLEGHDAEAGAEAIHSGGRRARRRERRWAKASHLSRRWVIEGHQLKELLYLRLRSSPMAKWVLGKCPIILGKGPHVEMQ